jgi:hypothetical protein
MRRSLSSRSTGTYSRLPTLINTLNLNYTRGLYDRTVPKAWQTRNLSTELGLPSGTTWGLPRFDTGSFQLGFSGSPNNVNVGIVKNQEETYNINNVLAWTRGGMTWKFGANLEQQQMANAAVGTFQGGVYTVSAARTNSALTGGTGGDSFASFLLGIPNGVDLRTSVVAYKYVWRSMDFFVQNDWKIRPNLTLNLGLRYSLELPRIERNNLQGNFDLEQSVRAPIPATFAAQVRAAYPNFPVELLPKETMIPAFAFTGRGGRNRYPQPVDANNFMPRVGLAWSPRLLGFNGASARSLVVRAGYGVSYLPLRGDELRSGGAESFRRQAGQCRAVVAGGIVLHRVAAAHVARLPAASHLHARPDQAATRRLLGRRQKLEGALRAAAGRNVALRDDFDRPGAQQPDRRDRSDSADARAVASQRQPSRADQGRRERASLRLRRRHARADSGRLPIVHALAAQRIQKHDRHAQSTRLQRPERAARQSEREERRRPAVLR